MTNSPLGLLITVLNSIPKEEIAAATKHLVKAIITAADLPKTRAAIIAEVNRQNPNVIYSINEETGELIRKEKETN